MSDFQETPHSKKTTKSFEKKLTALEHLEELRKRIIVTGIVIVIIMIAALPFSTYIVSFILEPVKASGNIVIQTLTPHEKFVTHLKVALLAGVAGSIPIILYQLVAYIWPALYVGERFWAGIGIGIVLGLFTIGFFFAFKVLTPYSIKFLADAFPYPESMGIDIENNWQFSKLINWIIMTVFACGVSFQLPIIMFILAKIGIVTPKFLAKKRRYAIVILLIFSAIFTDPSIYTQLLLFIPTYILYELGILAAYAATRKSRKHQEILVD